MTIVLVLYIVALVMGIISVVEGGLRNWAGWGVIALAIALIYAGLK